jgi:hypothetical protein
MNIARLVEVAVSLRDADREASFVTASGETIGFIRERFCHYDALPSDVASFAGVPLVELDCVPAGEVWVVRRIPL